MHGAQHIQQLSIRLHQAGFGEDAGSRSRYSTQLWKWFSHGELEAFMTAGQLGSKESTRNYLGSPQHQAADPHKLSSPATKEECVPFLLHFTNLTRCLSLAVSTQPKRKGAREYAAPGASPARWRAEGSGAQGQPAVSNSKGSCGVPASHPCDSPSQSWKHNPSSENKGTKAWKAQICLRRSFTSSPAQPLFPFEILYQQVMEGEQGNG